MHPAAGYLESDESQFNTNCTNFTVGDFKLLNRLRNITAFVCSMITLAILIFLIRSKAFSSLFKRLYFYLIVGTFFAEVAIALNIEHEWHYRGQEDVCVWLGFFTQWSCVLVFIFSYEIVLHLLCLVVTHIRGSRQPTQFQRSCIGSRHCTVTVEIVYIILPLAISTALAVHPYITGSYGIAGPWCWVQSLNEDCEPAGLVTQVTFFSMYMAVGVAGISASLVFVVMYYKIALSFQNARHLLKQTLYILIFQIVHILIIMYNLSIRIYTLLTRRHQRYGLWVADAITIPFGVLVFPFGYWLCLFSARSTVINIIRMITDSFKCYCLLSSRLIRRQFQSLSETDRDATAPKSDRITQPSHTFFNVQHPDDFTATMPLITRIDTGYDSATTSNV